MTACYGWSSVCADSVHSTVCHCARVAKVITVGSTAHVQAIQQLIEHHVKHARKNNNGTQPAFRALDARASSAVSHVLQTTFKFTVSCLDAYPSIQDQGRVLFDTPTTVEVTTRSLERDK